MPCAAGADCCIRADRATINVRRKCFWQSCFSLPARKSRRGEGRFPAGLDQLERPRDVERATRRDRGRVNRTLHTAQESGVVGKSSVRRHWSPAERLYRGPGSGPGNQVHVGTLPIGPAPHHQVIKRGRQIEPHNPARAHPDEINRSTADEYPFSYTNNTISRAKFIFLTVRFTMFRLTPVSQIIFGLFSLISILLINYKLFMCFTASIALNCVI